jgi:hypothetical protein
MAMQNCMDPPCGRSAMPQYLEPIDAGADILNCLISFALPQIHNLHASRILGYCGTYEQYCLLGYNPVSSVENQPTFRTNVARDQYEANSTRSCFLSHASRI